MSQESYDNLLRFGNEREIEDKIIDFIYSLKEKDLSGSFFGVCLASLRHFYEMNDCEERWRKITKFIGEGKPTEDDRPYTRQELSDIIYLY